MLKINLFYRLEKKWRKISSFNLIGKCLELMLSYVLYDNLLIDCCSLKLKKRSTVINNFGTKIGNIKITKSC